MTGNVLILILILCNQMRICLVSALSLYVILLLYLRSMYTNISYISNKGSLLRRQQQSTKAENSILTAAPYRLLPPLPLLLSLFVVLVVEFVVFAATTTIYIPLTLLSFLPPHRRRYR